MFKRQILFPSVAKINFCPNSLIKQCPKMGLNHHPMNLLSTDQPPPTYSVQPTTCTYSDNIHWPSTTYLFCDRISVSTFRVGVLLAPSDSFNKWTNLKLMRWSSRGRSSVWEKYLAYQENEYAMLILLPTHGVWWCKMFWQSVQLKRDSGLVRVSN